MDYGEHYKNIAKNFELDLLKETEFDLFNNIEFAEETIQLCLQLCENASKKLNIDLNFGILFNHTSNACVIIKNDSNVVIFNLGLINKLEAVISDSIKLLMYENIASLTILVDEKEKLERAIRSCSVNYLFYHELAHIIQNSKGCFNSEFTLEEKYAEEKNFDIKNHIYELDADHFGSVMSCHTLLEKLMNVQYHFETIFLFNALTSLLFSTANLMIEFSGSFFPKIYYEKNSHPHPLIRIIVCNEQFLSFISANLDVPAAFLETVLQRSSAMISQIQYSGGRKVNYSELYMENSKDISIYIDKTDSLNNNYQELVRHKSQYVFNILSK